MMVVGCGATNKKETENNILGIKKVNVNYLVVSEMTVTLPKTRTFPFPIVSARVPLCHSITECLPLQYKVSDLNFWDLTGYRLMIFLNFRHYNSPNHNDRDKTYSNIW